MTIYSLLVIAIWFIFLVVWILSAGNTKRSIGINWWFLIRVAIIVAVLVLFRSQIFTLLRASSPTVSPDASISALGVVLCALGIVFAIWARGHLGKNWGMPMTVKTEPELITTGPYAYVRHPIYTGVLLAILGSTLVSGPVWLITFGICCLYFIYAAVQEEKLMARTFPGQYPAYKDRTKMLIPYVF